jgi:hypothetical protein
MKLFQSLVLALFLAANAHAEDAFLAKQKVSPKLLDAGKTGDLVVALYKREMAKPDSALSKAIKAQLSGDEALVAPKANTLVFLGGSGGHNANGEEYTATYLLPIYYGFKSGTWPFAYVQVFTASNMTDKAEVTLEKLVDIQIVDKR